MHGRCWLAAALLSFAWCAQRIDAEAAYPPASPFLRIETGVHTANIKKIDVDRAERFAVTGSYDKTVRVWDVRTGELVQVLRAPQGPDMEGAIYAVAISPDGRTVAAGGYTGPVTGEISLYFFDRASGRVLHTITELASSVEHIAYSADGNYLVAALSAKGIRVYRLSDYSQVAGDENYGSYSFWAEFDHSDRLVTASFDGFIRLYDSTFRLVGKREAPGGKEPYSVRFSPDGSKVAVGFEDSPAVDVLSGRDLAFLYAPDTPQDGGDLSGIAWSRDGLTLYAAGSYRDASRMDQIMSWNLPRKRAAAHWSVSANTIMDVRTLSDGHILFVTADPVVGMIDRDGRSVWMHTPEILDYRSPAGTVRVSADGSMVEFGCFTYSWPHGSEKHVGRFAVTRKQIWWDVVPDGSLSDARTTGLDVKDWRDTDHPTLKGQALALQEFERAESLAISTSGDKFLLGAAWHLRLFQSTGKLIWEKSVPGVAWSVNLTSDGRYAVAGLADGTIRWYRTQDGEETMGLFVSPDGRRWVLWTPKGFYDSSPGGDALIGYHLNHGAEHEGEFVRVEQLKDQFYRPDLLAQRLKPESAEIVRSELARTGDVSSVLRSGLPPEVTRLSNAENESEGKFTFEFRVTNRGGGIGRIVYRIDGVEIQGRPVGPLMRGQDTVGRQFDLPPGRHTISATAYNGTNQLESRAISSVVNVRQIEQRPALYVVAVGISKYRDNSLNQGVTFAASDAKTIAQRLNQQGSGLFRAVIPYVLQDANASRDNIEKTVAEVAARIQPNDEFVLYLAGHGTAINGEYTFVPWNAIYTSSRALHDQSLNEERLQALLRSIGANKSLLLLDTCSAGAAIAGRDPQITEKGSIERLSKITGRAIIAASSSEQMALEGYENHGVFTYALLDALSTAVDTKGLIQVTTLADRVEELVPDITRQRWGYEQFPMRLITGQTFPIARKQ